MNEQKTVLLKYCGGCNPVIDREKIVRDLQGLTRSGTVLTGRLPAGGSAQEGILICGCSCACAQSKERIQFVSRWIVVAGTSVDLESVPEECLASAVIQKLG